MKIPHVDRAQVTPAHLEADWPRVLDLGGEFKLVAPGLFEGHGESEQLAAAILDHCVRGGGWNSFTVADNAEFARHEDWLQRFVCAGLLVEAGGTYLVTDLLILWIADYLRRSEERQLSPSVKRSIRRALFNGWCVNILYDHKLELVMLRNVPESET